MQFNIIGYNVEIIEVLCEFVMIKFVKFEQYFEWINQVYVVLKVERVMYILDVMLYVNGGEIYVSVEGQDMYVVIDGLIDKLVRQLIRYKDKLK